MSQGLKVDPTELRASAGACDDIAREMKDPSGKAVKEADTAGGSLTGWSMGPALTGIATSWKPALDGLHARCQAGGDNLRSTAKTHDWNEERVEQDFEQTGAETAAQAAYGGMPAALAPDELVHPVWRPGGTHEFDPAERPADGNLLDPRASYGTNMPTYDETISTQPAPARNDFG